MKKIFAVFFCLLFVFPLGICAQAASSGLLTIDAAENASSYVLTKMTYQSSYGGSSTTAYTYDKDFNLTKYTFSDSEGNKESSVYAYDTNGRMVSAVKETTYIDEDDYEYSSSDFSSYFYDSKGNVTVEGSLYRDLDNGNGATSSTIYIYDSKGNLKKTTELFGNEFQDIASYTYDSKGNLTKVAYPKSSTQKNTVYKYDSLGRVIKESPHYKNDENDFTWDYSYDNYGNRSRSEYSDYDGETKVFTYSFDSAGRILKEKETDIFDNSETFTYSYGSNGRLSKKTEKRFDGSSATYTYTYDKNGNNTGVSYKDSDGETRTYKLTYKKVTNGKVVINRSVVGGVTENVYRLSYASTAYNGKAKKPAVQIDGKLQGKDYRVSYSNNIKPGKGKIKITFVDGSTPVVITFDITPAAPKSVKVSKTTKNAAVLTWKKATGAAKYEVYKYTASSGKYTKVATVTDPKATVKNLKAGTTYQFCVVAVASGNVKSAYSAKVSATTKK